jgi:hypothetical protein
MRNAFSFSNVATARSRLAAASARAIGSRPTSVAPCSATRRGFPRGITSTTFVHLARALFAVSHRRDRGSRGCQSVAATDKDQRHYAGIALWPSVMQASTEKTEVEMPKGDMEQQHLQLGRFVSSIICRLLSTLRQNMRIAL